MLWILLNGISLSWNISTPSQAQLRKRSKELVAFRLHRQMRFTGHGVEGGREGEGKGKGEAADT